ncbi:MAG TPA: aminodeoxychorismate synthase component I [Rhizomicrobium sp.]|nr:aminodeoxychorismate synthase component I [Rhizomicrobium sp.]
MLVILDDGPRRVFSAPLAAIRADTEDELPAALEAVEKALARGHHVAGWLGYELGYALEPRLAQRARPGPLLRLGVFGSPGAEAPPVTGRAYAGPLKPEWDEARYAARFARVKDYIAAGDIYQANLSLRARFAFAGEPRALYEQLRAQSGALHCAYVDIFSEEGGWQILSLSPELFFDLGAGGRITVRPMKGTRARNGDDDGERAALAASPKDRAENLMIVDLIRNDLSRIAEPGSVDVNDLFEVETYPTLHTMVSTVTANKRKDVGIADILRALFPCGSVTGAPKIRAMEILQELESSPRGAYCGAVGHFAPDGSARFNVAIRTMTVWGDEGELGIGGGVVQDSRSESEYAECLLKARFFEAGRKQLELIETLRHENGFARLEAHLARMQASARVFGLAFDRDAATGALEKAAAGRRGALRMRLTLNEEGTHAASAHDLPFNPPHWTYVISPERTGSRDLFLRHKTNWRELYESESKRLGADEVIFLNERGEITEGARSNIFVKRGGTLLTPPLEAGLLPGILRAELLEQGRTKEVRLTPDDLKGEVYFGNALRGLIPAKPL